MNVLQIITEINSNSVKNQKFILKPNLKMTISPEYNIYIHGKVPSIENFRYYWTLESPGKTVGIYSKYRNSDRVSFVV